MSRDVADVVIQNEAMPTTDCGFIVFDKCKKIIYIYSNNQRKKINQHAKRSSVLIDETPHGSEAEQSTREQREHEKWRVRLPAAKQASCDLGLQRQSNKRRSNVGAQSQAPTELLC